MAKDGENSLGRMPSVWKTLSAVILVTSSLMQASIANAVPGLVQRADPIANGLLLKVLQIGDSITYGAPDPPYNGYRLPLHDLLSARGNPIECVGVVRAGAFEDNRNEGHRGKVIDSISDMSGTGIYAGANIVLLHAGTNDMNYDDHPDTAPDRLSKLIGYIYDHSPNAAVFVCQIIPSTTPDILARIKTFNQAVPGVVDDWLKKGKHVTLVDMYTGFDVKTDLHENDNLHPSTKGYAKMAQRYYDAIVAADMKGWIVKAAETKTPPPGTSGEECEADPVWTNVGEIAEGAHVAYDDGRFEASWDELGTFSEGLCPEKNLHFADFDGDGFKDWACVGDDGKVEAALQSPANGKPRNVWQPRFTIATGGSGRKASGVLFADLNGDGLDDYIYVDASNGNVQAWINKGKNLDSSGDPWLWKDIGVVNGNNVGATPENLQMADLDGDGRADFLIVSNRTGAVDAWLNGGAGDVPEYISIGQAATGTSAKEGDRVILGDLTGNGRADYMIISQDREVTGLVNYRQEVGLIPQWDYPVDVASISDTLPGTVRMIDLNGDGKADWVLVQPEGPTKVYLNSGVGGRYQIGDGVFLCDVDGDGMDDYLWADQDGNSWVYLNDGDGQDSWNPLGQVIFSNGEWDRHQMRMATITKSGRADLVIVDDDQGACKWATNTGPLPNDAGWGFEGFYSLATGPRHTVEGAPYNWRWDPRRVRFADLTGDGLDDYLYINTDGAVLMWRNQNTDPPSWGPPHLVADGPKKGVWWTDVQFADIGDFGLEDYIQVSRFTGRTDTWRNRGGNDDGSIRWDVPTNFATGPGPSGYNIRIAQMTSDNRADYVSVRPNNGRLWLWKNGCAPLPPSGTTGGGPSSSPQPSPRSVLLHYHGCTGQEMNQLSDAWNWMVKAADDIRNSFPLTRTDFAASDYFGDGALSNDDAKAIRTVLQNLRTYGQGYFFGWTIDLHCDDFKRKKNDPCPPGTLTRDESKCGSSCWSWNRVGSDIIWKPNAPAYADNPGSGDSGVGKINFCPGWFNLPLCQQAYEKGFQSKRDSYKYDLTNYLCKEYALVHELMHLDKVSSVGHLSHITDMVILPSQANTQEVKAYGPTYAKILANWKYSPEKYTMQNADSYALYFLSRWILWKGAYYPDEPIVDDVPARVPRPGKE